MKKRVFFSILTCAFTCMASAQDAKMDAFISDLMSKMTLEEKIGQLNLSNNRMYVTAANTGNHDGGEDMLKAGKMGAYYGFMNHDKIKELQETAVSTGHKIPLIFGMDVIHGAETVYPIPLAMSTSWNMNLIEESARMAAKEATAIGVNWVYSPMVDICRDARWGRIAEGAGEDPFLGGEIAKAYVHGYQGRDNKFGTDEVMVCVKHYALYGGAEAGRDYNTVNLSRQEALNGFMVPYREAAFAGAGSYMSSFNEFEGIPASINHYLLTELLRDQWNFKGFVVSDATAVQEVIAHGIGDLQEVSQRALRAGLDMDMNSNGFVTTLMKSYKEGKVSEADINLACRRILEAKYKLGLFQDPFRYIREGAVEKEIFTPAQIAFARKAAQQSQVLLKNSNNILPLKKNAKIALVGPLANDKKNMAGCWAMSSHSSQCVSILEGVQAALKGGSITYAEGSWLMNDTIIEKNLKNGFMGFMRGNRQNKPLHERSQKELLDEALKVAKDADVIVACVGEINDMSGEGASRSNINIPDAQEDLLKALKATGKPLVVVLTTGRPLTLKWEDENADAILNTWQLGQEAGHAIADVLFGDVNPSGKLTTSFPRSVGQLPLYYNHKNTGRPHPDYAPYRKFTSCYIDELNGPLYPFGFGLSYTNYEYGKPTVSSSTLTKDGQITVSVDVKNTGARDGEEVVQLYIQDIFATSTRPVQELRGFQRVAIKAGETKTVKFTLTQNDLKYYNHDLNYVCEPGEFKIMVGPNSRDVESISIQAL